MRHNGDSSLARYRMSDNRTNTAEQLERFIHDSIPLAGALQFRIHAWSGEHIEVRAPLAGNDNDKGCAFGGSLASLMTLAPWALLELGLREAGLDADLFVADAHIRYLAPIFQDLEIHAEPEAGAKPADFRQQLRRRGRARISMRATVGNGKRVACEQQARFVAKLRGSPAGGDAAQ